MKNEIGGTLLGFIIGVVVGLAAALAVAVYITKVPVPFMNKGQTRSADQNDAETKKNKDWDPNAALSGKGNAKTAPAGSASDPAAAASAPAPAAKPDAKPAASTDPLGDFAKAKSASADGDAFNYFIQLGAYKSQEDAEGQRAKLQLAGIETKVTDREQNGRMVYRVRVGPFEKKDDADKAREKLDKSGLETTLIRVQR